MSATSMMLRSARETEEQPTKHVQVKKKGPDTIKHQLRTFGPWINRFGCAMLRRLATEEKGKNVAIASGSLFVMMGALSRASEPGETEETCNALFGKKPLHFDKLAKEMSKMPTEESACKWSVVSTLFLPADRKPDADFAAMMESKFGIEVQKLKAKKDAAEIIKEITGHAREKSDRLADVAIGHPRDLEKYRSSLNCVVGVYVHPCWSCRFSKALTSDGDFYETKDKVTRVSMMKRTSMLPFVEMDLFDGTGVRMVGLPCRDKGATAFLILPKNRFKLTETVSHLTGDRASHLIGYCTPTRVQLSMPKVHMAFQNELRTTFASVGVQSWLNTHRPAFDGITRKGNGVSLGRIYHQVMLKMNEEGESTPNVTGDPDEEPIEFECNQPFVVMMHHTATNAIWMLAEVRRPNTRGRQEEGRSAKEKTKKKEATKIEESDEM